MGTSWLTRTLLRRRRLLLLESANLFPDSRKVLVI